MEFNGPDAAAMLRAAGLPVDIESPEVQGRQLAIARAVVEAIRSVPAAREPGHEPAAGS
jgi:hypothetical protein